MRDFFTETYPGFVGLLRERSKLAEEYFKLTLRLKEAVEAEDTEGLGACLTERGRLIEAIEALGRELEEPMKLYNEAVASGGAGARAAEAGEALERTRESFMRVRELDAANMKAVSALMGRTAGEGKKLKDSREGIGKYAQKDMGFAPSFINELK